VQLLQAYQHAAEVLADELFEEILLSVSCGDAMFMEDFVGQIGAGLEGQTFGLNEGVVAIEENVLDLDETWVSQLKSPTQIVAPTYLPHGKDEFLKEGCA